MDTGHVISTQHVSMDKSQMPEQVHRLRMQMPVSTSSSQSLQN